MAVIDLTGKKFNHWTVLERAKNDKSGNAMWLCECDCEQHIQKIVKGSSLRSGHSKSCGCLKKQVAAELGRNNAKNLLGQKFGKLKVIQKAESKNYRAYWVCECECGNSTIVSTDKLISGHTKSCGCLTWNNLLGQTFGKLTVIEKTDKRDKGSGTIIWKCQCNCPSKNIIEVSAYKLLQGEATHCGCEGMLSAGEAKIKMLLTENNLSFKKEKIFLDCKYENNQYPRFDFYVNNSYIIEYDGEQHFKSHSNSFFTPEKVEQIQKNDMFKNEWCKNNNIPIIRIPYTHLKELKIEDLLLDTSQFIVN